MIKTYALTVLAIVVLVLAFGFYEHNNEINDASQEAAKAQTDLAETNGKLEALEKRVKELEDTKSLEEERIAGLEGRFFPK